MLKIGELLLKHGLILAPMAGYSDYSMRRLCRDAGAELCVSEMVSAKALTYNDKKTHPIARIREDEAPAAVQLFGHEPEVMAEAARIVARGSAGGIAPAFIDVNMGCPVHKIVAGGDGCALMRDAGLAAEIVAAVREATPLPVTVKIRSGWDDGSINAPAFARAIERAGANAICVHGRTRAQMYAGEADLDVIRRVREEINISLIGNGDVRDAKSAIYMYEVCGCDGIAVGRGAVGNPFVFSEIIAALDGVSYIAPTLRERIDTAMEQLRLATLDKGEYVAVRESRKQLGSYIQGFPGAAAVRGDINSADSADAIRKIFERLL